MAIVEEILPEWEHFARAAEVRRTDAGTWCEGWTVRDVVVHQAGNAEELARVLARHLLGDPVETRGFEEREAPYRALASDELWAALVRRLEELAETCQAAEKELGPATEVAWTGRTMRVAWFAEHMREELVLHRWDLTGDDPTALAALAEPWMTVHSVVAVGRPLLARGARALREGGTEVHARLRVEGTEDVVLDLSPEALDITLAPPEGPATIESDAGVRCLFLWGRRPADPARWWSSAGPDQLRRVRGLLSGY